ncbi:MAG: bifunctional folylpolyglutamate synthase/dihydrofolate synthase [Desulfobacterales bacterium]|nr:bifunctional folylpolyglutamate synthase/dihydrofolate synthase [Desulfobacterales bacterium]
MTQQKSYHYCLQEMLRLRRFGIKLGLSKIRDILNALGNPQDSFPCIHIAGTNGKGSIAASLSTILSTFGYKVGLYTSPHLVKFNERIQINNCPITDERVVGLYQEIKRGISASAPPTFFEYATAMAFYEFKARQVDWAVIETGMGGRLDATNIIKEPAITIITNIALEHQTFLGNTLAGIAAEKVGIIKPGVPVISGARQNTAKKTLQQIAREHGAPFHQFGRDFNVRRQPDGTFNYFGIEHIWRRLQTGLPGSHQVDNAALTLCACELLKKRSVNLDVEQITSALLNTKWPGRLEIVSNAPLVILDGAHNLIAVKQLATYLSTLQATRFANRNLTFVIGILDDKPYRSMLKCLLPMARKVILTQPGIDRALPPGILHEFASGFIPDARVIPNVGDAVEYAIKTASAQDIICIAGSLYVVGEAKEKFQQLPELLAGNLICPAPGVQA